MAGSVKLGQPVPESNFVLELNSSLPHAAQRYIPSSFECTYLPVNGGSVPCRRMTSYSSGVSSWRHSCSLFSTFASIVRPPGPADEFVVPRTLGGHLAEDSEQLRGDAPDLEPGPDLLPPGTAHRRAL